MWWTNQEYLETISTQANRNYNYVIFDPLTKVTARVRLVPRVRVTVSSLTSSGSTFTIFLQKSQNPVCIHSWCSEGLSCGLEHFSGLVDSLWFGGQHH